MPSKRALLLGMTQQVADKVATARVTDLQASMRNMLLESMENITRPVLEMDKVFTGSVSYVNLSNEVSGFLWGLHTWGIDAIADTEYDQVEDIPVNSIQSLL